MTRGSGRAISQGIEEGEKQDFDVQKTPVSRRKNRTQGVQRCFTQLWIYMEVSLTSRLWMARTC